MKILGASISGLTAAINLTLKGHKVEVYEKNPEIGMQIKENVQMLPNWLTEKSDIIQELRQCNIKINPFSQINTINLFIGGRKIHTFKSSKPFGHTVIRGGPNSLEMDLKKQAEKLGVTIHTNWHGEIKTDIIATGHKKVVAVIYGRVYEGNFNPGEVHVFIDFKYYPGGYAYLYPHNETRASLVVGKLASRKINLKESMKRLIDYHGNVLDVFNLSLLYEFVGSAGVDIPKTAIKNGSLYVGEAAGFQDPLFGFGMKYAIKSGYFAAMSITEKKNYDVLWKRDFLPEIKKLLAIRNLFYRIDEKTIAPLLKLSNNFKNLDAEKIRFLLSSSKINLFLCLYNKLAKLPFLQRAMLRGAFKFSQIF